MAAWNDSDNSEAGSIPRPTGGKPRGRNGRAGEDDRRDSLLDALEARGGLVCLVGAGGKKTAMRRLVEAHPGRVALTCTTKILAFGVPGSTGWIAREESELGDAVREAAARQRVVAYCGPPAGGRRYEGVTPERIEALHREGAFDVTYLKADGARMRLVKAHRSDEPHLVRRPSTIVNLCSVRAVGRPLDERVAHRPELVAELTGARLGEPLAPFHLARLIAKQSRALAGSAPEVVPVINMADDDELAETARHVARLAFDEGQAMRKVVVARLMADCPLVEVVTA